MTQSKPKGTKTERLAEQRFRRSLRMLENDDIMDDYLDRNIPCAWATLERDIDVTEKKIKITLRLDESVVKFYRSMGNGYQARMNRILATYAQMRISQCHKHDALMKKMYPAKVAF